VFRRGDLLDRRSHGRLVIEVRQLVRPGTIHVQMCFDIGDQMGYACVARVTGATVMHIANGALDGVGLRTGGWQEEQGNPRVGGQPWLDSLRLMDFRVIHNHREPRIPLGRIVHLDAAH
jgi:hypothetical protein